MGPATVRGRVARSWLFPRMAHPPYYCYLIGLSDHLVISGDGDDASRPIAYRLPMLKLKGIIRAQASQMTP
jgi:hypothetical protein